MLHYQFAIVICIVVNNNYQPVKTKLTYFRVWKKRWTVNENQKYQLSVNVAPQFFTQDAPVHSTPKSHFVMLAC